MQERTERADTPDEPAWRSPERARDDLRQRRERLADGHPSSDYYREATERASSAWETPEVRGHPDRPAESHINVTGDRARHILDGDPDSDGGGHRHGTGRPGKTEFPKDWPDDVIVSTVEDVSRKPDNVEWQPNGKWRVSGDRDGDRVSVIVQPDGRIWTAWPEPGGRSVVQNPEGS